MYIFCYFKYFLRLLLPAGNDLTFNFNWIHGNASTFDIGDSPSNITDVGEQASNNNNTQNMLMESSTQVF